MSRWLVALVLVGATAHPAVAVHEFSTEETIADLLATPPAPPEESLEKRQWAVLPEVGFGPDTGGVFGAKFTHRNFVGSGATLDLDTSIAFQGQYQVSLELGTPHLLDDRFLALLEANFRLDPQREFFGLGNNDLPFDADPLSTELLQRTEVSFTGGWRPRPGLALSGSLGLRYVSVRHGTRDGAIPLTVQRFPDLPGAEGGYVNFASVSLVWTNREEVVRPTHGWRTILKVTHGNGLTLSDFQFTRFMADVSELIPLFGGAHVLALRADGAVIVGPRRYIPFWELEPLGGDDTLRGYFPDRFLGTSRLLANVEYRFYLFGFHFFDVWQVRVEGAAFGGIGRVFVDKNDLRSSFHVGPAVIGRQIDDLRYTYGGGVRFELSEALVARVDVGFSDEETGLVYLAFGHTF